MPLRIIKGETDDTEVFDLLKQRITVGVIGAVFAVLVLCLGVKFVAAAVALVALIGLSEIYSAVGLLKTQNKLCVFGYIYTAAVFVIVTISSRPAFALGILSCIYGIGLLVYMIFNHNVVGFAEVSELFFSTSYVTVLLAHIVILRKETLGNYFIWIVFITAWLSDTMAFAVGRRFGRNKLLPEVSPKKTVEGALGGLAGSVLFNLIFGVICSSFFGRSVYYMQLILLALVAGATSQLGDLAASCIKREHGIKDFSNLLPGHGGILDRFDSVLFVAPVVYYFVVIFSVIA